MSIPVMRINRKDQEWVMNEKFHRLDGPAIIRANGDKEWWINDQLHRTDGPAFIGENGTQEWWVNGKLHRLDGPAITHGLRGLNPGGVNGKKHRLNGPAVIYANGDEEWWVNGKYHREDGPAIIRSNYIRKWFLNDNHITPDVDIWMKTNDYIWDKDVPWDETIVAEFLLKFL